MWGKREQVATGAAAGGDRGSSRWRQGQQGPDVLLLVVVMVVLPLLVLRLLVLRCAGHLTRGGMRSRMESRCKSSASAPALHPLTSTCPPNTRQSDTTRT